MDGITAHTHKKEELKSIRQRIRGERKKIAHRIIVHRRHRLRCSARNAFVCLKNAAVYRIHVEKCCTSILSITNNRTSRKKEQNENECPATQTSEEKKLVNFLCAFASLSSSSIQQERKKAVLMFNSVVSASFSIYFNIKFNFLFLTMAFLERTKKKQ